MPLMRCVLAVCCISLIFSVIGCEKEEEKGFYLKNITVGDVKEGEIETFARTYIKVQSALEEPAEEKGEQTYKRTTSIVRREGLTVERYTQLAQLMNEDAGFKKEVDEMIRKIKRENAGAASEAAK